MFSEERLLWSISLGNVLVNKVEWIASLQDLSEPVHVRCETPRADCDIVL